MKSTGPHRFTVVSDKVGKGTDPFSQQPREELQMIIEENGQQKLWNIPIKDLQGNLHYLVAKLAEIKEGDEVIAEMKKKGMKNYVDLRKVGENGDVPTVQLDDNNEDSGATLPSLEDGEEAKIFRQRRFRSKTDPQVEHTVTLYWGGTMQRMVARGGKQDPCRLSRLAEGRARRVRQQRDN